MADHHDTLARIIKMLQAIPRHPGRIATTTLQAKLEDQGHPALTAARLETNGV